MPVYNYSFKKYLKLKSTWIIMLVSFLATFLIVGPVVFGNINYATIQPNEYIISSVFIYSGMTTFFSFLGAIFTAFTGSKVFKDEVEDGTFLIVLSKPVSRGRIIFEKWLAYATMLLFFAFLIDFAFILAALIYDKYDSANPAGSQLKEVLISSNLNTAFWIILAVGLVIIFIFSSLALMISTRLSVGATIGLTTAVALVIPITQFIGQFTDKETHLVNYTRPSQGSTFDLAQNENREPIATIGGIQITADMINNITVTVPNNPGVQFTFTGTPTQKLQQLVNYYSASVNSLVTTGFGNNNGIGSTGIRKEDSTSYSYLSLVDLNYQMTRLGSIASSVGVSQERLNRAYETAGFTGNQSVRQSSQTALKQVVKHKYTNSEITTSLNSFSGQVVTFADGIYENILNASGQEAINAAVPEQGTRLNTIINLSSFVDPSALLADGNEVLTAVQKTDFQTAITNASSDPDNINAPIIAAFNYLASVGKLDEISYSDFLNKYGILGFYLALTFVLVPLSYFVVKRQDFR